MSEDNLRWKIESLFKGINIVDAYKEVERIKNKYGGEITSHILLNESRETENVFYPYFNWDDADAAEKYRLQQAGSLLRNIQVNIIADGSIKQLRVYEVVKNNETGQGVYKNIETFSADDVDHVARMTLRQLIQFQDKLKHYSQFAIVTKHLNDAIEELQEITSPV
jgi:hypothetical protein